MNNNIIIIRYGELFLKGKNRRFFENKLIANIKEKLIDFNCSIKFNRSRYIVSDYLLEKEKDIMSVLKTVFGIHSVSAGLISPADINSIENTATEISPKKGSFRVNTHRGDKTFPLNSMQVSEEIGYRMLTKNQDLRVDLHNPDFAVNIDIREDKTALIYSDIVLCAGGMPVGTSGKGLLLLSGGLDSPVAGYMMAKRGLTIEALHFHSYPYTSQMAKQKVIDLKDKMQTYCGRINLLSISTTKLQEAVHKYCEDSYMITLLRRFMMRVAEQVALRHNCGCIVNGESLGQVASQTLESINVTNFVVKTLPVFRPCIGLDKSEIISVAQKMGTYDISIRPYEDCCTVFLPEFPATKPTIERAEREEEKLGNYEELVLEAVDNLEII